MRIRFQVGGEASPARIAGYLKARRYDEAKHRRHPRGSREGGKFAPQYGTGIVQLAAAPYYDATLERTPPGAADLLAAAWEPAGEKPCSPDRGISRTWIVTTPDGRKWFGKRMWRNRRQAQHEEVVYKLGRALGMAVVPAINVDVREIDDGGAAIPEGLKVVSDRFMSPYLTLFPFIDGADGRQIDAGVDPAKAALSRLSPDFRLRLWLFDYLVASTDRHNGNWRLRGLSALPADDSLLDDRLLLIDNGFSLGWGDMERLTTLNAFFVTRGENFNASSPVDNSYLRWLEEGVAEIDPILDYHADLFAQETLIGDRREGAEREEKLQRNRTAMRRTLYGQLASLQRAFAAVGQGEHRTTILGELWKALGAA